MTETNNSHYKMEYYFTTPIDVDDIAEAWFYDDKKIREAKEQAELFNALSKCFGRVDDEEELARDIAIFLSPKGENFITRLAAAIEEATP